MHTTGRSSSASYNCFVDFVGQSSRISENVFLFTIFFIYFYFFVLFQKRVPGFHQVSKSEKTFETTFGNLMKPEARVFEITSATKKISRNYNFNKFSEFKHISYLRRGMSGPVIYLVLPCVLAFNATSVLLGYMYL